MDKMIGIIKKVQAIAPGNISNNLLYFHCDVFICKLHIRFLKLELTPNTANLRQEASWRCFCHFYTNIPKELCAMLALSHISAKENNLLKNK